MKTLTTITVYSPDGFVDGLSCGFVTTDEAQAFAFNAAITGSNVAIGENGNLVVTCGCEPKHWQVTFNAPEKIIGYDGEIEGLDNLIVSATDGFRDQMDDQDLM